MMKNGVVLVPTDFEELSDRALEEARQVAEALAAELCILHALPTTPDFAASSVASSLVGRGEEIIGATVRALEQRAEVGDDTSTMLREGDPSAAILAAIDEVHPTLVVMGTHGRRGLSRLVLGSVAETVLRKSPVPVMTVNAHTAESSAGSDPGAPILVPMDFGPAAEQALALARDLGRELRAGLCLLHVDQLFVANPEMGNVYAAAAEADLEEAERYLDERSYAIGGARTLLREGEAATEILATIEELRPRLVVMGTHGRSGLARLAFGSVAERVVRQSEAPVLTVRAQRGASKNAGAAA